MDNKFKKIRLAMGLNQKDFAEKIGIKQSYYSSLEKGDKTPSMRVLDKVWELGVSYEWFREGKGEMFNRIFESKTSQDENIANSNKKKYQDYANQMSNNKLDIVENNRDFLYRHFGESEIQPFNHEYLQIKYYNQFSSKRLKEIKEMKMSNYESKYNSRATLSKMLFCFGGPDFMLEKFPEEQPFPKWIKEMDQEFKEEMEDLKDLKLKKIMYILHLDGEIEQEDYLLEKVINYIGMYKDMLRDHIKVEILKSIKKEYPDIDILKAVYGIDSTE